MSKPLIQSRSTVISPKSFATVFLLMLITAFSLHGEAKDMMSGTWGMHFSKMFGENKKGGKNLDIYPVFENGRMVNALVTARGFNSSIHFLKDADINVDPEAKTISGKMTLLMTPDLWVPADGQSFEISLEIDGELLPKEDGEIGLSGKYVAVRPDGKAIYGSENKVEGHLGGAVGLTESGWENSVWQAGMSQEVPRGYLDQDALKLQIGVDGDKVVWAAIGPTAQAKWPSHKAYPIDVSSFGPVSPHGKVSASIELSGRHIHVGGDPDQRFKFDVTVYRVQGLIGALGTLSPIGEAPDASWPRNLAGRGSGWRGGGDSVPFDNWLWKDEIDNRPWWQPVANFEAPKPGEHPRLLFRKDDLPTLRARARTAQGQSILKRLREVLGNNGESLPTRFSETPPANIRSTDAQPYGTFTSWHAAGYGFLYQITGEEKYAKFSRQCVEWMLEGKFDVDNRYSWIQPGTGIRCGSVLAAMAYAYDFSYDAWPEDFRQKVALEIQNFDKVTATDASGHAKRVKRAEEQGEPIPPQASTSIKDLVGRTGYPPGSNHYGSLIGGTGVALLAIRNDPGVNTEWVDARLAELETNIPRMLQMGFGDGGYYSEGFPPSRLSSEGGFLELLQAMKKAGGKDYINVDRPNASAISYRWIYHLGGPGMLNFPSRGTYGGDELYQDGVRGTWAFGFGALKEKYKPAFLWSYENFAESKDPVIWNSVTYPISAVHAFVNWPEGESENPAKVLPKVLIDRDHGYVCARNRWQDADDIIVTHLAECGPKGYYSARDGQGEGRAGRLRVWGLGQKHAFDVGATGTPSYFRAGEDGSFVFTGSSALAVDMSGASGADLVVVTVGYKAKKKKSIPKAITLLKLTHEGEQLPVQVFSLGEVPEPSVKENVIIVGKQEFLYDGKNIVPKVFKAQK